MMKPMKHLSSMPFWLTLFLFMSMSFSAHSLEKDFLPDLKKGVVNISIQEPGRDVGYTVGDTLTRDITLHVKKPYKLIEKSFPIEGYQRRYKGKLIGVDLQKLTYSKTENSDEEIYKISLTYQVFTNKVVAKPAALPAEYLRVMDTTKKKKNVYRYRIPSWNFSISPIAVYGQVKVESDMSDYRGPLLLDSTNEKARLKLLLPLLGISFLGLVYMLGKHAWLPRMGGPLAKAYKQIRRADATETGLQSALTSMHQALDKTAKRSLFSSNMADFIAEKPKYAAIETEMQQFFDLSRQVFFEPDQLQKTPQQALDWLAVFCKQCRDCERGLIPDSIATTGVTNG